jgi:UDP-N-acetylglucosamine pyrophosphorylase
LSFANQAFLDRPSSFADAALPPPSLFISGQVAARTDADKKGGHLARSKATGGLLLREAAQCPDEDEASFQDVAKHKFFNTNNLWVNLPALKKAYTEYDGLLPLPVMKNAKTVDPRDKASTKVCA